MKVWERALDLLFPPKCPFCQKILDDPRAPLCPKCQGKLPWLEGRAGERRIDFADGCWSSLAYDDLVRSAVHHYKFHRVRALEGPLAVLMAQCLAGRLPQGADVICWAPLSRKRFRKRGFNQAELLAREIGRLLSIPAEPLLKKVKDTGPQSDLEEESARRANARGAYALLPGVSLTGRRVVLVDDVVTTGSTLSELCALLRQAGAAEVYCLTLARARGDGHQSGPPKKQENC
jgi:ComF family protein